MFIQRTDRRCYWIGLARASGDVRAARLNVNGVQRLAPRHKQPVPLNTSEADIRADFRKQNHSDPLARRRNVLCSLSDDELSPAALATRVVLADCARELVRSGRWVGATLIDD